MVREVNGTVLRCHWRVRIAMARIAGSQRAMVGVTTTQDRQTDVTLTMDHGAGITRAPTKLTRAERPTISLFRIAKSEIHVLTSEITASALEVTLVLTLTTVNVPMAKTREIRENMQNGRQEPVVGIVGKTMQASTQDVAMEETMIGCVLGEPIGARQGM